MRCDYFHKKSFLKLFKMMDYRRIKTRPEALGKNVEFISAMTGRQERVLVTIGDSEGLHPNDLGHEIMAHKLQNFLENL